MKSSKRIFLILIAMFLMLSIPSVSAQFDFRREEGEGTAVQISYEGETGSVDTVVIENTGVCGLKCTYHTNQDSTENEVPGSGGGWIGPYVTSKQFSVPVTAIGTDGSGVLTITVTCSVTGQGVCRDEPPPVSKEVEFQFGYCGDGDYTPTYENCETCPSEVPCEGSEKCDPDNPRADSRGCTTPRCGDGYADAGETPQTCCDDTGCSAEEEITWLDVRTCSPDSKKVIQSGEAFVEECNLVSHSCEKKIIGEKTREESDCSLKGTDCQEGKCVEAQSTSIETSETVTLTECGNLKQEAGETQLNCCLDVPCWEDTSTYYFVCNKESKACEQKYQPLVLYGTIGVIIIYTLLTFWFVKSAPLRKKSA